MGYMTGDDPTADFHTVGAVSITRLNAGGTITDAIQSVRACACGPLSTGEKFPQEKWSRWQHSTYDFWNRQLAVRIYNRIPKRGIGEAGCNFDEVSFAFDDMGRLIRSLDASGTIKHTVYDSRGLVVSNWMGTDDNGATAADPTGGGATGNNMQMTSAQEYDDGESGGDGNITQLTQPVDDDSANDRITTFDYDYRDRRDALTTTDGTTTWNTTTTYDNLNRPLQNSTFVVGGNLIAQNRAYYDALGRVYLQETDGVDPSTGDVTSTLSGQNWFDLLGNLLKSAPMGSTSFTKTAYDALNRPTVAYSANVPGTAGVPTGDDNDVSSDTVLQQNEAEYDNGGNVILTTQRQRFDDATGTGPLQNVQSQPKARVSYSGNWPDGIGRPRAAANFGTNGGAALVRPDVAPARSDTVLVTTNHYKDDGDANAIIDPEGLETRWENDDRGRRITLIKNFLEGCPEKSQISEYVWHPSGQLQQLTLVNGDTGNQVTKWIFGTTLEDSTIASNNLLRTKIYPESEDRPVGPDGVYAQLQYTYNRQGQKVTFIDADGTEHDYAYDQLGRLISDAVPTLGPGLDDSILRIERAYEVRGMLQAISSYSAASGGTVVNESAFAYDAFRNLITDQQSHSGAVVTSTTPQVGYSYADGSANTVRRTSTIYPNGQALNVQYGAANSADDHLNRVTALQLASESNTLVAYTYVGLAWQVLVGYAGPAVEMTYIQQSGEPVGDAGDPYNGYDRFGRTVDIRWQSTNTGNAQLERLQYGFGRDSRRTWRQRVLTTDLDNAYNYDGLSQVTNATVGNLNLNHTAISGIPAQDEAWDYDPTGNWNGYRTQANGEVTLDQSRVYDKGNRLTQISADPQPVLLDQVGRMLQVSPDAAGDWNQSLVLQWDAWSRIVQISQNGGVIGSYAYDGLSRRLTRTTGGVTLHTYYSDAWRPLEERIDPQTAPAAQYFWGTRHRDDLVRRDRATTNGGALDETRYVLMDYFSPATITDGNGTVIERYAFSAFGIRTILTPDFTPIASSECAWTFAFQGQFLDEESGFLDYGYRYYSPLLGRWLSRDPIAEKGGINLYGYVGNSPINAIDPLGLEIRLYGAPGFGNTYVNHEFLWSTDLQKGAGTWGSSGYEGASGTSSTGNGTPDGFNSDGSNYPYNVVNTNGLTDAEFMNRVSQDDLLNKGLYFPYLNDCHNGAQNAVNAAGGSVQDLPRVTSYPGAIAQALGLEQAANFVNSVIDSTVDAVRNFITGVHGASPF
jgi:RHS repeat-associated protein